MRENTTEGLILQLPLIALTCFTALGFFLRSVPAAQQPQPPLDVQPSVHLRADLVTVTVTVTSPGGNLLGNLEMEDFEVYEDDIIQRISTFSRHSDLPLSMVMVFDASMSIKSRLGFEKETLHRFLQTVVRPIDRVAVLSVSTDVTLVQPFTADLGQLQSATARLTAEGATALYDSIELSAALLDGRQGQRVLIIFSDGRDTISRIPLLGALRRAQDADVVIFAINVAGRPGSANVRDLAGERALETLCRKTGGEAFFPDKVEELDPAFSRLAEELRTQYVLGFSPTNELLDGSYRRLAVRVRRENAVARSREGYYAPKP